MNGISLHESAWNSTDSLNTAQVNCTCQTKNRYLFYPLTFFFFLVNKSPVGESQNMSMRFVHVCEFRDVQRSHFFPFPFLDFALYSTACYLTTLIRWGEKCTLVSRVIFLFSSYSRLRDSWTSHASNNI